MSFIINEFNSLYNQVGNAVLPAHGMIFGAMLWIKKARGIMTRWHQIIIISEFWDLEHIW